MAKAMQHVRTSEAHYKPRWAITSTSLIEPDTCVGVSDRDPFLVVGEIVEHFDLHAPIPLLCGLTVIGTAADREAQADADFAAGRSKTFSSIEDMFADLDDDE